MSVSSADYFNSSDALLEIIEVIQADRPVAERRLQVGQHLLHILRAQTFVSYVHGPNGPFLDPIGINMGKEALDAYDNHYRHVDIVTPVLFRQGGASRISPPFDSKEEFVRDFLHSRGMYHGMNFFARPPAAGKADLRIWRNASQGAFTDHEVRLLSGVGGLIERMWSSPVPDTDVQLTPRQAQVAELVTAGLRDKEICSRLSLSLPTLRTHLRNIYHKTKVNNRAGLAAYYAQYRH
ncbi:hypothetical protein GCM10009720_28960 [Yaniella flava]|uniref:HTH luxR-type domain-containing protein n=1 Tax=Yaniella flava TaxID=287930 RepID=A0ABP5GII2_9MICC